MRKREPTLAQQRTPHTHAMHASTRTHPEMKTAPMASLQGRLVLPHSGQSVGKYLIKSSSLLPGPTPVL